MNSLDEIKHYIIQNFKLEELIGEDTEIKKSGSRLQACCPFHEEKTPSFYIFSDHYHCFGCKAHGDIINYVREKRGLGFLDAIEFLGEKLGIDTSPIRQNRKGKAEWEKRSHQEKACSLAHTFFTKALYGPFGKQAYSYIQSRGYTDAQIKEFGFGFAMNSPKALSQHLMERGFKAEDLEEFSLANRNGSETYDFFRGRLMIPIRDVTGRFIAFAGRTLGNSPQKYKNSRYDKKSFLFGLDHAHKAIKKTGRALVVEGYLDAIRLWSLGLHEAVACQGTALTLEHMNKLRGLAKEVYLVFDGDAAGKQAALKTVSDSQKTPGLSFYYVPLPEGEDPDSYTKTHGPNGLEELIQKAPPLIEFIIRDRFQSTPEQRTPELLREEIIPWIRGTVDPIQQAYFLRKVSELSGISEDIIRSELPHSPKEAKAPKIPAPEKPRPSQPAPPSKNYKLKPYLKDLVGHLYFTSSEEQLDLREVHELYKKRLELPEPWAPFFEEILKSLEKTEGSPSDRELHTWEASQSPDIREFLESLREKREAFRCDNRSNKVQGLVKLHEGELLKERIKALKDEVKKQANGSKASCDPRLITEISRLVRELSELRNPS